ncbi:FUSC family protein [Nocardioides sp. NPDC006303]|uniref:FUSC family protein n=1 Tax=Nocardioides sp. NPDC006303 TaxID=3156747 RepID=UPI0033AF08D1
MAFSTPRVTRDQVESDVRRRLARLKSKRWHVLQAAGAAGVAWFIAATLLGHAQPVFAPIAAVVSLGTSYGQRLRRVTEVTIGVALGVFLGDVVVQVIGDGAWQMTLVVAMAMAVGIFISSGQVFRNQAAVQSIFVMGLLPTPGAAFTRWTDALIGGAVALVAASIVPAAPLRRPGEQAAVVAKKIASLLRAAGQVMLDADAVHGLKVLADARATDPLIRELQDASDEGMSVLAVSPFRFRHRSHVHRMAELVEPLDRALRSTRVLVRRAAVSAYRGDVVPESYYQLAFGLADAVDVVETELRAGRSPDGLSQEARSVLLAVGEHSAEVERTESLNAEVILVQIRSIIVDLLGVTGMGQFEATDALPPLPPR